MVVAALTIATPDFPERVLAGSQRGNGFADLVIYADRSAGPEGGVPRLCAYQHPDW
jgi:hypothetical protein